jgi:predicted DNA-binding transcriptional regulator AlpA
MKTTKLGKWLSVRQYSLKTGKSRQQIYLDIRTGKIPKNKSRLAIIKVKRLQILTIN